MSSDECIKNYLPPDFMPTEKDVVCARGKEAFLHPGNKRYRDIIDLNLDKYKGAKNKNEKSKLVMEIVEEVRQDAPAGLIRFCDVEQLWYEIGDEAAREKVGQTLRETLIQRDPEKRAKKRIKRAVNKAKRAAAQKALDIEPLTVKQNDGFSGMSRQPAVMPLPLTATRAWSAPPNVLQSAASALLTASSAPTHRRQSQHDEVNDAGTFKLNFPPSRRQGVFQENGTMDLEPLSVDHAPHFPSLLSTCGAFTAGPLPLTTSKSAPVNLLGSSPAVRFQQQMAAQDFVRQPSLRGMSAKDLEILAAAAAAPPTLAAMTSGQWLTRATDEGGSSSLNEPEFEDFEKQLFEVCRGLSAAA